MPKSILFTVCLAMIVTASYPANAQRSRRAASAGTVPGGTAEIYKTIGDVKLKLYRFTPDGHTADDQRPAVVFFFGGGWRTGSPKQFEHQCKYLASRGMVAMTADYRVSSRHGTKAVACVADAKSAVRWIRSNAKRLGIDPDRIVAGGGSAGGHIAACTGTIRGFDEASEDGSISSVPNAMMLFNPACVLAPIGDKTPFDAERMATLKERVGDEPIAVSPYHHVREGCPPTILFHGKNDTAVAYRTAQAFTNAMTKAGNRCELVGFDDMPHGFFNFGKFRNAPFTQTMLHADRFLTSLGYLKGEPTTQDYVKATAH